MEPLIGTLDRERDCHQILKRVNCLDGWLLPPLLTRDKSLVISSKGLGLLASFPPSWSREEGVGLGEFTGERATNPISNLHNSRVGLW